MVKPHDSQWKKKRCVRIYIYIYIYIKHNIEHKKRVVFDGFIIPSAI